MDAISAGRTTHDHHAITFAFGNCGTCFTDFHDTYCHRIHEGIIRIAIIEIYLATNGWYAKAISIMTDSMHHAFHEIFRSG